MAAHSFEGSRDKQCHSMSHFWVMSPIRSRVFDFYRSKRGRHLAYCSFIYYLNFYQLLSLNHNFFDQVAQHLFAEFHSLQLRLHLVQAQSKHRESASLKSRGVPRYLVRRVLTNSASLCSKSDCRSCTFLFHSGSRLYDRNHVL